MVEATFDIIEENKTAISNNSQRITNLDSKVNNLQGEMSKGFAMSVAMSTGTKQETMIGAGAPYKIRIFRS